MHRLRCVACVAFVTDRYVWVALRSLHALRRTRNVYRLCIALCVIVYVERNVQTRHIPFDTPASEVFSRPSTQMLQNNASKTAR